MCEIKQGSSHLKTFETQLLAGLRQYNFSLPDKAVAHIAEVARWATGGESEWLVPTVSEMNLIINFTEKREKWS